MGISLVVLVVTILSFALPLEAMQTWGWRLVFGIGAALALLGWVLRRDMEVTADTERVDRRVTLASLFEPMRRHPRQTIRVIGLTIGFTAMAYAWGTYFPTYAATYEGLELQWPLLSLFVTSVAMIFVTPLAGLVTGRLGRKPVLINRGGAAHGGHRASALFPQRLGASADRHPGAGNCVIALIQASAMPAYAELFPKKFRAAGFGFPYSLTVGLIGGSVPLVGTQFVNVGLPQLFPWYLVALMAISTVFYIGMRETAFKPLPE